MEVDKEIKVLPANKYLLLSLYGVIPLVLIVSILDQLKFNGFLLDTVLPKTPSDWIYWGIVFNLPHILASWITFADSEYIARYKSLFTVQIPVTLVIVLVLHGAVGGLIAFAVFSIFTMYHVMSQQIGIAALMMGLKQGGMYRFWRWLTILCSLFIYANVYMPMSIYRTAYENLSLPIIFHFSSATALILLFVIAIRLGRESRSQSGLIYFWANYALIASCFALELMGYSVFVIAIPRFVHDLTAFIVYISHDHNRNSVNTNNYIYKWLSFTRIPIVILCPLLAIASAYILKINYSEVVGLIIISLTYLHYYFEGYIWKNNGIHRKSVVFS